MITKIKFLTATALALCIVTSSLLGQGSLTPPGAPAPGMKTLQQIEPRTPISAVPFIITNSGSYYLTTNLIGAAGQFGILINADNVELALGGFTLAGVAGSLDGILATNGHSGLAVSGGRVRGWGGFGIKAGSVSNGRIEQLQVSANTGGGVQAGAGSLIQNCIISSNSGDGLQLSSASYAQGNQLNGNGSTTTAAGLRVTGTDNRVDGNHVVAGAGYGLKVAGTGNLIVRNSARSNGSANYSIVNGNDFGQILSPGGNFTNDVPWANFGPGGAAVCGNGVIEYGETCDDANTVNGDGCSSVCATQPGYICNGSPSVCTNTAVCGNGLLEAGEQCDDANTANGDGCSATCQIEPSACGDGIVQGFAGEACDDGNASNGDGCSATCQVQAGWQCTGSPSVCSGICGDGLLVGNEQCDSANLNGQTCIGFGYAGGTLACNGNCTFNLSGCTAVNCGNGIVESGESCDDGNLTNGDGCSATCAVQAGFLCAGSPSVCTTICGDGIRAGSEQCDDGNTSNGDGCSATCQFETTTEVEPNATTAQADASSVQISSSSRVSGAISPTADLDYFRMNLGGTTVVRLETFDSSGVDCVGGMTTTLRYYNSSGTQLVLDNTSGIQACSAIVYNAPAGTSYVSVEETGNNATIPAYQLQVALLNSTFAEVEPNDTLITATTLSGREPVAIGGHQVGTDLDYYAITVPVGGSVRAEVIEGTGAETCESNGIDSQLTLFNSAGTQLQTDDDNGRGFCSLIDGTGSVPLHAAAHNLAAGTYYLRVQASSFASGAAAQFDYKLVVTIR